MPRFVLVAVAGLLLVGGCRTDGDDGPPPTDEAAGTAADDLCEFAAPLADAVWPDGTPTLRHDTGDTGDPEACRWAADRRRLTVADEARPLTEIVDEWPRSIAGVELCGPRRNVAVVGTPADAGDEVRWRTVYAARENSGSTIWVVAVDVEGFTEAFVEEFVCPLVR